mmetsp:Transcript_4499/g.4970  ORF Transcript_4499/g.4970 Transcript_4499/m.4970 type:complete len:423 (-) Transcript_4499:90-1358(-)
MKTIDLSGEIPSHEQIKLSEVSKIIFKARKTVVLTGAGISCNAGIPDFRSSDGLYNMVKSKFPKKVVKGQDLFDISIFRDEITLLLFCTFMESLYLSSIDAKPTETHRFIKILKEKKKLLRCYTQNIDGLEDKMNLKMGINLSEFDCNGPFNKTWQDLDVVQLHGNINNLACTQCFHSFNWNMEYREQFSNGSNPECKNCYLKYQERLYLGKRLTGNIGMLRPNIVLYGENHPQAEILANGLNKDVNLKPDLFIIMGTSLKVDGIKKLVKTLAQSVHNRGGTVLFVNKTPISQAMWSNIIDYEILCDCDEFVKLLKYEIPDLFLTQEQLDSKKLNQNLMPSPLTKAQIKKEQNLKSQIKKPTKMCVKKEPIRRIKKETTKRTDKKETTIPSRIKQENSQAFESIQKPLYEESKQHIKVESST